MRFYILKGRDPVACDDARAWSNWFEKADRRVAQTKVGGVRVSTVFLGINHAFMGGTPILFETMVFGGPDDGCMERSCSWSAAESIHGRIVEEQMLLVSKRSGAVGLETEPEMTGQGGRPKNDRK